MAKKKLNKYYKNCLIAIISKESVWLLKPETQIKLSRTKGLASDLTSAFAILQCVLLVKGETLFESEAKDS